MKTYGTWGQQEKLFGARTFELVKKSATKVQYILNWFAFKN